MDFELPQLMVFTNVRPLIVKCLIDHAGQRIFMFYSVQFTTPFLRLLPQSYKPHI